MSAEDHLPVPSQSMRISSGIAVLDAILGDGFVPRRLYLAEDNYYQLAMGGTG
jgi:hypothetical protein